ncbi:hypothetical protein KUM39_16570 [Streptomyces sp. J2-1]|uniref:hypothetical protein n=1 Tax=Streptomyces corallincola TaxID=2851888 RepID=UPI001C395392|nr:hypothetical protein [Streptomyces corallincola]MBV2355970.1 hypothetical protein [Streptomyces corallincola]
MSLTGLFEGADGITLAASGLACSDRCLPLLGSDEELLRPLWAALAEDADWAAALDKARGAVGSAVPGEDEAVTLARRMLLEAPGDRDVAALRAWAESCSTDSLRVHLLLDPTAHLESGELRRQTTTLDLLTHRGPQGLRPALDLTVEGRRILRAALSRRARTHS